MAVNALYPLTDHLCHTTEVVAMFWMGVDCIRNFDGDLQRARCIPSPDEIVDTVHRNTLEELVMICFAIWVAIFTNIAAAARSSTLD